MFVDPYSELAARSEPAGSRARQRSRRLFKAWGLRLLPDIGRRPTGAMRGGSACRRPGGGTEAMDYVAWLNLRGGELNRDDVITASLNQVTMASAGILEPLPGATTSSSR